MTKGWLAYFLKCSVVCAALVGAGCGSESGNDEGKEAGTDSQTDLGVSYNDGGGQPTEDGGSSQEDTGGPTDDGGSAPADQSSPEEDQGTPAQDQGGQSPDGPTVKLDTGSSPDTKPTPDQGGPLPDLGGAPSATKVAAVQYGAGQAAAVAPACNTNLKPDVCALMEMTLEARQAGASVVVLPEYALSDDQEYLEPVPSLGSNPGNNASWPDDVLLKIFSKYANQLDIYLVVDMITYTGTDPNYNLYNTQVAFDPEGDVVGVHHKFELFGNEKNGLTAGTDVMVFDTPLGKMGLLICADIYGSSTLLNKLTNTLDARVVAFSSYWTVSGAVNWQTNFADDYNVYLIASNTTHSPGYGGGVYDTSGNALEQAVSTTPSIVLADIPLP